MNNKFIFLNALVAAIFISYQVSAIELKDFTGGETGNGGDVVVCYENYGQPNQTIRSVELLDYYEGRIIHGLKVDLGIEGDFQKRITIALERLEKFSPGRAQAYRRWAQGFEKEAIYAPGITLTDVPDSQEIFIPNDCKIEQLVIQKKPELPLEKRYVFAKDLYDRLDETNKAGAHLHEMIYRELLSQTFPQSDSRKARYFNAFISSKLTETLKPEQLAATRDAIGFNAYDVGAGLIRRGVLDENNHWSDWDYGDIITTELAQDTELFVNGNYIKLNKVILNFGEFNTFPYISGGYIPGRLRMSFACHDFEFSPDWPKYEPLRFYPSFSRGAYDHQLSISRGEIPLYPELMHRSKGAYLRFDGPIYFYRTGAISLGNTHGFPFGYLMVQGKKIEGISGSVSLFSDGTPFNFIIQEEINLKTAAGTNQTFIQDDELTLNHEGLVTKFSNISDPNRHSKWADDVSQYVGDMFDCN